MSMATKDHATANAGEVSGLSNLVRRLFAPNPSPYTYTGTGSFLVGHDSIAVIDPGPAISTHVDNLGAAACNGSITHIFVTHTHVDHSPAAVLLKEKTGATIYGFGPHGRSNDAEDEDTFVEEGVDLKFEPDIHIADGEIVKTGEWTIQALHTPGHTSNHMCFVLREEKCVFTGDHVMGWATSVISPPDGNMADYMHSLERLMARDDIIYRPTHGPAIENPQDHVVSLIKQRKEREALIMAAVKDGKTSLPDITTSAYASVPKGLHRAAARSALAHLIFLTEKGQITMKGHGANAFFTPHA